MVERALDDCNLVFMNDANGSLIEPELPRALKRKIKFARQCLKAIPELSAFQLEGVLLLDEVSRLIQLRHTLVHGTIQNFRKEGTVFIFEMLDTLKRAQKRSLWEVEKAALISAGQDCLQLADRLDDFAQRITRAFVK
jgi:hypothetical protein